MFDSRISIDAMADELNVHFKLSDRSVQTVLGAVLKPYPDSYLTQLVFNDAFKSAKDDQGYFCVDEDPQIFASILTFYRHGQLVLPDFFVDIRDSIINKYLLPIQRSNRPRLKTTTYTTYVRLRGEIHEFYTGRSTESKVYQCTVVDPLWNDLPESEESDYELSATEADGIQYVLKSFLTMMNWLVARGYEIEHWDKEKQEANLKKVSTRQS